MRRRLMTLCALAVGGLGLASAAVGDLALVSLADGGAQGDQDVTAVAVSADGRFVAFTSPSQLTAVPTGGVRQLYVRDRGTGRTVLASASAAGAPATLPVDDDDVGNPRFAISGDGRYVVFATAAGNLVSADANGNDVFRKDLQTGQVALVSVDSQGRQANGPVGGDPDVSWDGSRVAFTTGAATTLFADSNGALSDVVVRDLAAGTTVLVAQSSASAQAAGPTERPAISADGRVVAFEATLAADNLVAGDVNALNDVFVRNLAAGTTTPVSRTAPLAEGGGGFPDVSGDGRHVAFETADRLDPVNDPNAAIDVYRRDLVTGAATLISAKDQSAAAGDKDARRPSISADGGQVAFRTAAPLAGAGDANAVDDVYLRTPATSRSERASGLAGGTGSANPSDYPALAPGGALVGFLFSDAGAAVKLVASDVNARRDAIVRETAPTDVTGPQIALTGPADGLATADAQVTVAGSAADPSGVVEVVVNGRPALLGAGGGFSTDVTLPLGTSAITVSARDGGGSVAQLARSATRTSPSGAVTGAGGGPGAAPAVRRTRATRLTATLKGRRVTVRFTLAARARVRAQLLSRTLRATPRRVVFRGLGRAVVRTLGPGRGVVVVPVPRLAAGRYQVRVSVTSAGGVATTTAALRVAPAPSR